VFRATFVLNLDEYALRILLEALCSLNAYHLSIHSDTPPLFTSGVRYQSEPPGIERWSTIPDVIRRGVGDCEDLACWRVAELRNAGEAARPHILRIDPTLFHIQVDRYDRLEDPSRILGMR
jgi:hypothetical protein